MGSAALAGCIPASTAPTTPRAAPPQASSGAESRAPDHERQSVAVVGGDPRPTWTLKPVSPNARQVSPGLYTVRVGDTLRSIGEMSGAGSEAIAMENDLSPPFTLRVGQQLRIPAGLYHRVAAGETGIGIARAYGADWGEIVTINALSEPYILRVGQRLRLPAYAKAGPPAPVDIATRAAAFRLDIDDIATGSQPAIGERGAPAAPSAAPRKAVTTAVATPPVFTGRFLWPLDGRLIGRFGPVAPGKVNDGINISAPRGTPIHAAANGVVAYAGDQIAVYGGLILIDHGSGWMSAYGHAGQIDVRRGQSVKAGDVIGLSGASGQVQAPQLHFQLRKNRVPVDPLKQLPAR